MILAWWAWRAYATPRPPRVSTIQAQAAEDRLTHKLAEFNRVWDQSFTHGHETRETVRRLYDLAADVQNTCTDVLFALPNDTAERRRVKEWAASIRRDHRDKIEDLKVRCGAPLLYPGPLENHDDVEEETSFASLD